MSKKKPIRSRNWTFTVNNYTEEDIKIILTQKHYIFGKEIGDGGTPHLQGYFSYKNARTFKSIKKLLPKAHIEKAKGSKKQNIKYCTKHNNYYTNMNGIRKPIIDYFKNYKPYEWQQDILDLIKKEPDDRTVNWYWESEGGVGKSALCRHLAFKHNALVVGGTNNDILCGIKHWLEEKELTLVVIDIARSSFNNISYKAIEKIKDMNFFSGKYNPQMVIYNKVHLIVFANYPPDMDKLSHDRWNIINIYDNIIGAEAPPYALTSERVPPVKHFSPLAQNEAVRKV